MSLRRVSDRKLMLMVISPIARALLWLLLGYLAAKGVSQNLLDELAATFGVAAIGVFNVGWELIDRKRAENRAVSKAVDTFDGTEEPYEHPW